MRGVPRGGFRFSEQRHRRGLPKSERIPVWIYLRHVHLLGFPAYLWSVLEECENFLRRAYCLHRVLTPLVVSSDTIGDSFLDVETPRELMQTAVGELGDVHIGLRRLLNRLRGCLRALVVPKIEFASKKIEETVLNSDNERSAVVLHKCERRCECSRADDKRTGYENRQNPPEYVTYAESAGDKDELSEGQRTENLILYLDKLRHLKLHGVSIPVFDATVRGILRLFGKNKGYSYPGTSSA